jgi:hypothetical protein
MSKERQTIGGIRALGTFMATEMQILRDKHLKQPKCRHTTWYMLDIGGGNVMLALAFEVAYMDLETFM